jgi:hypothetical protein
MTERDQDDFLASVFEERAEYLSREELVRWTVQTPNDHAVLAKLKGAGAKLLTGPRGCGKSSFMRRAYFDLQDSGTVLVAYVNYARSLALEPMFHRNANALALFRQWVLYKIALGVRGSLGPAATRLPDLVRLTDHAEAYVKALEVGEEPTSELPRLSPSELLRLLEAWTHDLGRRRCVLLLDDAAHAFSPRQQREFFEIFRELRSRSVAPKAAVYPGVTSYSPNFNITHEAELIEAWLRPDDPDYLDTMATLADTRLPESLSKKLAGREELVEYLALAAFGLPRGFLNMLSDLLGIDDEAATATPTRYKADQAISDHAESVRNVFLSLADKLPRMRNFVDVGSELTTAMLGRLQSFNRPRTRSKAVVVGLRTPVGKELDRIIELLEYAGVVRRLSTVSRGEKGVFERVMVHYALVLSSNALSLGRSPSVASAVTALYQREAAAFPRSTGASLLGPEFAERCTLDLAPCQYCGSPRLSEDAQFCMQCGKPLTDISIYDELLSASIASLPLTANKLSGLKRHTDIRTVQDVLLDDENRKLLSVPRIGPVWASRIHNYAEEFVTL